MNRQHPLILLVLILLLAACAPAELEPAAAGGTVVITRATETALPPTPTLVETPTPTVTPLVTRTPVLAPGQLPPTPDGPTAVPPTRTPAAPPEGLIIRTNAGLWRTELAAPAEQLALLFDRPDAILSPDGREAIYLEEADIWWVDLSSGDRRNVTAGTNRNHCCAQWWPSNPGWIIFGSQPEDVDLGPTNGYLSMVHADGSDYTILDDEIQSNALPAPGPDDFIAYDRGGSAWLYGPNGSEPFDVSRYETLPELIRIAGPSWSPAGDRLAWTVAVPLGPQGWQIGVAVFDLFSDQAWLLHPYENIGRGGWFPPVAWSPDGRWLAYVVEAVDREAAGLWVVAADGSTESFIAVGHEPHWSPDGSWLAFNGEVNGESGVWLAQSGSWGLIRLDIPPDAAIVDWR